MNSLVSVFTSSIGKKLLMAVTGFCFCGFLVVHLIGNLTVYGGSDMFNAYVAHLHSLGLLINVAELGLLFLAIVHVSTGTILFIQNWRARPVSPVQGGRHRLQRQNLLSAPSSVYSCALQQRHR